MLLNNLISQQALLFSYWIIYCIVCVPAVYILVRFLPLKLRYKPLWPFMYFYFLAVTLVFSGIFLVMIMVILLRFFPTRMRAMIPLTTAMYPDFQQPPQSNRAPWGEGAGFKMATESKVSKTSRKEMLVMMNQTESPAINKINQLVLEDSEDEIRLYAQSLMEKQEERLLHLTTKFTKALHHAKDPVDEARYKKTIANILWEQIYKGLTTHLNLDSALDRIQILALEAFEILPEDNELPLLLAKIAMRHRNFEDAKAWLRTAEMNDAPDFKIISYIAEIAFHERNYAAVRNLLSDKYIIGLQPITSFWMIRE